MDLDKPLPEDVQLVLRVAAMLEASEYEVFMLAFQRWAGDEASTERLEPIFVRYMFESYVPPWVRTFGLDVERGLRTGSMSASSVTQRAPRLGEPGRGARYAVLVALVTAVVIVLAEASARFLGLADRCVFPPCY